jgi:1-acyl-sn-glycerol-3-phosphate acyltransferase
MLSTPKVASATQIFESLIGFARLSCAILVLLISAAVVFAFSVATLFSARDFTMQHIVRTSARVLLKIYGFDVIYTGPAFDKQQKIYIGNHLSAYDIFFICSLGLPHTRYFLSVSTLATLPLAIVGLCTGVFFIPEQKDPEGRIKCFRNAEEKLKKTGDSVYLTPEGFRNKNFNIQKFNRGAFHMATKLKIPIVSLYINSPRECHPGLGTRAKGGTIHIRQIQMTQTKLWLESDIDTNKENIRAGYLQANSGYEST